MIDWASLLWIVGDRRKNKEGVPNERRKVKRFCAAAKRLDDSIDNFARVMTKHCEAAKK